MRSSPYDIYQTNITCCKQSTYMYISVYHVVMQTSSPLIQSTNRIVLTCNVKFIRSTHNCQFNMTKYARDRVQYNLRMEMRNVLEKQPDHRQKADNSRRLSMGLQHSKKMPHLEACYDMSDISSIQLNIWTLLCKVTEQKTYMVTHYIHRHTSRSRNHQHTKTCCPTEP